MKIFYPEALNAQKMNSRDCHFFKAQEVFKFSSITKFCEVKGPSIE